MKSLDYEKSQEFRSSGVQIAYANLLVFSKHYFEVRVLCFVLSGTLGDLLYKLFIFIHVIYFAFIIGGLANIIILTTIPD